MNKYNYLESDNSYAGGFFRYDDFCPACGEEYYLPDIPGAQAYCINPRCEECALKVLEQDENDPYY